MGYLENKTILVTGGTGSFGQQFAAMTLQHHNPKALRIFSRGEFLQQEMRKTFKDDPRLRFFIGDIRDRERVNRAVNGADIVVHAAALKQVPTCEYNPIEAVKTNIQGAVNLIDAAIDHNVAKVIAVSTDKAVHPVNLYGATKMVMERLLVQANVYTGEGKTQFSCVRYGNVIGSRGSVIPLFIEQRKKGVITITDERMTRFWITLEQGVRFVTESIDRMQGGEIFIPKIPSTRVTDIADVIAPEAKRQVVGIRPGEKVDEVLLTEEEAKHALEFDGYYVIQPEFPFWSKEKLNGGKTLPEGFKYTSNGNSWWLTQKELEAMLEGI